ncbi:MAG: bifunctional riboflavin kinase/FAD synthetase [Thermodesulfobacteriota bacterium]|nr:bifunctional riboflavin kinase/FAD synthetase [Thermodesulfobacteriota bacterium]
MMELITDVAEITAPLNNAVLTIGNFDGVHLGHQALFRQVMEKARSINGTSVVMTFEPHPIRVLNCGKHFRLITLYEQKVELIAATGIDTLICVPFTRAFAATPARAFVKDILCDVIGMKGVVVGQDYSFGKKREGNIALLKDMGRTYGFEVIVSGWVEAGPRRISSTEVRNLVAEGQMVEARQLLGRYYQVRGTVIRGRDRGGRLLGFPTANLRLTDELCPKGGVYTVTVEVEDKTYEGVANIGYSPTFDNGEFSIEVHILDFDQDIYDQPIRVNFIHRLRGEKRFSGPEALATQINKDITQAREILSRP